MDAKTSFKNRTELAKAAALFSKIESVCANGKPKSIFVPGHTGKTYEVILRRHTNMIECECLLCTPLGHIDCQGASKTVCYHEMAAVIVAATYGNASATICKSKGAATCINKIKKGTIIEIRSKNAPKSVWAVVSNS